MLNYDIYDDIAMRTGGDIYLGIVGPEIYIAARYIFGYRWSRAYRQIDVYKKVHGIAYSRQDRR